MKRRLALRDADEDEDEDEQRTTRPPLRYEGRSIHADRTPTEDGSGVVCEPCGILGDRGDKDYLLHETLLDLGKSQSDLQQLRTEFANQREQIAVENAMRYREARQRAREEVRNEVRCEVQNEVREQMRSETKRVEAERDARPSEHDLLEELECPICLQTMYPIATFLCGHSTCKTCASALDQPKCPSCRAPSVQRLESGEPVVQLIGRYPPVTARNFGLEKLGKCFVRSSLGCNHKDCTAQLAGYEALARHVDAECPERTIVCDAGPAAGTRCTTTVRRKNLDEHRRTACAFVKKECKWAGCAFRNYPEALKAHERLYCPYERPSLDPHSRSKVCLQTTNVVVCAESKFYYHPSAQLLGFLRLAADDRPDYGGEREPLVHVLGCRPQRCAALLKQNAEYHRAIRPDPGETWSRVITDIVYRQRTRRGHIHTLKSTIPSTVTLQNSLGSQWTHYHIHPGQKVVVPYLVQFDLTPYDEPEWTVQCDELWMCEFYLEDLPARNGSTAVVLTVRVYTPSRGREPLVMRQNAIGQPCAEDSRHTPSVHLCMDTSFCEFSVDTGGSRGSVGVNVGASNRSQIKCAFGSAHPGWQEDSSWSVPVGHAPYPYHPGKHARGKGYSKADQTTRHNFWTHHCVRFSARLTQIFGMVDMATDEARTALIAANRRLVSAYYAAGCVDDATSTILASDELNGHSHAHATFANLVHDPRSLFDAMKKANDSRHAYTDGFLWRPRPPSLKLGKER